VLSTHWGLDHCFKHMPEAIVNFLLTAFIVYAILQSFWQRDLKPVFRAGLTLIGLARELDRSVVGCQAPWAGLLARAP
jgi:ACR3 family arsenite efflux pump ArsB